MTYHRARVCASLATSSLLLASIVRLTNALQDKQTRSRVNVDKQTSRVQTASASLRMHITAIPVCCVVATRDLVEETVHIPLL